MSAVVLRLLTAGYGTDPNCRHGLPRSANWGEADQM
jgi:hypothetical protein